MRNAELSIPNSKSNAECGIVYSKFQIPNSKFPISKFKIQNFRFGSIQLTTKNFKLKPKQNADN